MQLNVSYSESENKVMTPSKTETDSNGFITEIYNGIREDREVLLRIKSLSACSVLPSYVATDSDGNMDIENRSSEGLIRILPSWSAQLNLKCKRGPDENGEGWVIGFADAPGVFFYKVAFLP